jgi:hypothetical protein
MKSTAKSEDTRKPSQEVAEVEAEPSVVAPSPTRQQICERAYQIHLERGAEHGSDLDDWLQAESELKPN